MTVTFQSGAQNVYRMSNAGILLQSSSLDGTFNRANTNFSIRDLYDRATERGYDVQLHSQADVDAAMERNRARRSENARDIAQAEVSGTRQSRYISRYSGRINAGRSRGR